MSATSLIYYNDQFAKTQTRVLRLEYNITAAKTVSPLIPNSAVLTAFDAISAQATIDDFLGSTTEFNYLAFDATSMGTDAFAGIINMGGQAKQVTQMVCRTFTGTAGVTQFVSQVQKSSSLTNTSLSTQVACGSSGNIAFKAVLTGVDALTSGTINVDIYWVSK